MTYLLGASLDEKSTEFGKARDNSDSGIFLIPPTNYAIRRGRGIPLRVSISESAYLHESPALSLPGKIFAPTIVKFLYEQNS
jgi:hypothetical protein